MKTFASLMEKRRSIRQFEKKEVPLAVVEEIIRDGCCAPSARNEQPWHFIIVRDSTMLKKLSDESKAAILREIESNPDSPLALYKEVMKIEHFNVFWDAPCVVYIVGPAHVRSLEVDCTLAASYFMLSATSRGLGTCWVALGSYIKDQGLRREMGLPDDFRIIAPIALGYPQMIPAATPREAPKILKTL